MIKCKADDKIIIISVLEAAEITKRLEYDCSWDKVGSGYYSLKKQLNEIDCEEINFLK